MTMDDYILQVNELKTRFHVGRRTVYAVNGVSFALRRGRTLGIVGESGCGKSVTARSVLQLLPASARIEGGEITYYPAGRAPLRLTDFGRRSRAMREVRGADISIIFQDPLSSLNPVYTVGAQIAENLRQHEKISKKDAFARAVELLRELGIPEPEKRAREYPHQFSGGMKQRAMIAIATVCAPQILIADEPTTALDVTIQAQILELMKKLQRERGTSIILITHNMGIVAEMCDDVAVMYMGRIVEAGSARQLLTDPQHPYTAALLRAVPVLGMGQAGELDSIPGQTPDGGTDFAGCAFADRCAFASEACRLRQPPAVETEPGHTVRCFLREKEAEHG